MPTALKTINLCLNASLLLLLQLAQFFFIIPEQAQILLEKGANFKKDTIIASGIISRNRLTVGIADLLKIKPSEMSALLLVKTGDTVKKNQPVAVKKAGKEGKQTEAIVSTFDGVIISVDNGKGEIVVGTDIKEYQLKSPGRGVVGDFDNGGLFLDYEGEEIGLESGLGQPASGMLMVFGKEHEEVNPLLLPAELDEKIILAHTWGKAAAVKTEALGAKGILGAIFLYDFTDEVKKSFAFGNDIIHPAFTIGQISEADFKEISGYNNKIIILDGENKKVCLLRI